VGGVQIKKNANLNFPIQENNKSMVEGKLTRLENAIKRRWGGDFQFVMLEGRKKTAKFF
jgi:hypothetical protein